MKTLESFLSENQELQCEPQTLSNHGAETYSRPSGPGG